MNPVRHSLGLLVSVGLLSAAIGCSQGALIGMRDGGVGADASRPYARADECGNGVDDDDNGRIDDGCPCGLGETHACFAGAIASRRVGTCTDGVQTCAVASGIEWGDWGDAPCVGGVAPAAEQCDGMDHDCDGARDEDCPCTAGATQGCGASFTLAPCHAGTQSCEPTGAWSACAGAVGPTADVCLPSGAGDGIDQDCDNALDEGCGCVPEPEVCGDGLDNDCDGETDEPACRVRPDAGVPACIPTTCETLGAECGRIGDGCGGVLDCGPACPNVGETCGGGGTANQCGAGTCTLATCATLGAECGLASDGCGDVLDCGSACPAEESCGGGGIANHCGGGLPDAGPRTDAGPATGCLGARCPSELLASLPTTGRCLVQDADYLYTTGADGTGEVIHRINKVDGTVTVLADRPAAAGPLQEMDARDVDSGWLYVGGFEDLPGPSDPAFVGRIPVGGGPLSVIARVPAARSVPNRIVDLDATPDRVLFVTSEVEGLFTVRPAGGAVASVPGSTDASLPSRWFSGFEVGPTSIFLMPIDSYSMFTLPLAGGVPVLEHSCAPVPIAGTTDGCGSGDPWSCCTYIAGFFSQEIAEVVADELGWVAFEANASRGGGAATYRVATSTAELVPPTPGYQYYYACDKLVVSPDGYLYYPVTPPAPGASTEIRRLPRAGGVEELVRRGNVQSFVVDATYLYTVDQLGDLYRQRTP